MVIPAFTFSNYFFLALGIGDAFGKIIIIIIPDDIYSAVIMTTGHCESSLGSLMNVEQRTTRTSGRRPSDQATLLGL